MRDVTINGKPFRVADEPADFWGWVAKGNYDCEWAIIDKFVRPEHTFIDLGAWVGSHSLYASTIAKRVLAVEPDPVAFKILAENAANNSDGNIYWLRTAISNHHGVITLGSGLLGASTTRVNSHEGAGIGAWQEGQTFGIECITLRKLVQDFYVEDPLFIKMDVEGSEEQILQDIDFFAEHKPTMYLELHPFWWKNEQAGWDSVRKVAGLYKNVLNLQLHPTSLDSGQSKSIVLTDVS